MGVLQVDTADSVPSSRPARIGHDCWAYPPPGFWSCNLCEMMPPHPPRFVPSGQCKEATYCLALAPQYGCPSAPRSTTFEARYVHMESRRQKANVRMQLCVVACSPGDGSRNMLKVMNTTSNRTDSMKSRHMQLEGRKHGVRLQVRATRMKSCSWFALPTRPG